MKKLSVAFIWHMHQPSYKDPETGLYLMPWTRFHAVKDYLDMLLVLKNFPKIKQNFNIVPSLIDQFEDYGQHNAHDMVSFLSCKKINELTPSDKKYILDNFFDANFDNLIAPHSEYLKLYEKLFNGAAVDDFSNEEFSDIMAWFNLVWFDPYWIETDVELKMLIEKGKNYTDDDRLKIIEIQRKIIRQIIPTYREFMQSGQIELSTSPYYHPILPLLLDKNSAKEADPNSSLPFEEFDFKDDASEQIRLALEKFDSVFGTKPKGMWSSEQCLSNETLKLLNSFNIKWTVADEGILAHSLQKEFVKNFKGVNEDPYDLSRMYNSHGVNVLFRDPVIANLIGFEYGHYQQRDSAHDLYERLKVTQSKLATSPANGHIVTIAMDGENCWETYQGDGHAFLDELYSLISHDETLETVRVSDFIERNKEIQKAPQLSNIASGSWIKRNFNTWIGDPVKNMAWDYLAKVKKDMKFANVDNETFRKAQKDFFAAQGSDWFWWYGDPNDSGQDYVFDSLFRNRLKNVYKTLNMPIPDFLHFPLEMFLGKPSVNIKGLFSPDIDGFDGADEWTKAGCIDIPHSYSEDGVLRRVLFGNDEQNIYFRFDLNKDYEDNLNSIHIYFYLPNSKEALACITPKVRTNNLTNRHIFNYEVELILNHNKAMQPTLSKASANGLWEVSLTDEIEYAYNDIAELKLPFDSLGLKSAQQLDFVVLASKAQLLQTVLPKNQQLSVVRP